jgi:hypothetical protein
MGNSHNWLLANLSAVSAEEAAMLRAGVDGWFARARPEQLPWPTAAELRAHAGLLAAVRHANDMPAVLATALARPDWVLSTNTRHWNEDLTARTGLRAAHPAAFLAALQPSWPAALARQCVVTSRATRQQHRLPATRAPRPHCNPATPVS